MSKGQKNKQGCLISVEGADGAGKSTQIDHIASVLTDNNIKATVTREPGGTPLGEALRDALLHNKGAALLPDTELLLMFAARAEHYAQVIAPALQIGSWVISDRFSDASYAYQGASGVPQSRIEQLERWVLGDFKPHLSLLFDLPIEIGLSRVDTRGEKDRFEQEGLNYKQAVRDIYLERAAAEPQRIKVIDASLEVEQVSALVGSTLQQFIDDKRT